MLFSLFCVSLFALALFVSELSFRNLPLIFCIWFGFFCTWFCCIFCILVIASHCWCWRLQDELSPMDLAIVEHCPTKVNSLNIPRVENNSSTHPSHYSTSITPGGTPLQLSIDNESGKSFPFRAGMAQNLCLQINSYPTRI